MLELIVPISPEGWDETKLEFVDPEVQVLELEHSLVAISKWEAKYRRAFISKKEMTDEETIDYIRFMTLNKNVNPDTYSHLTDENLKEVSEYINHPMSATVFPADKGNGQQGPRNNDVITADLIYFWMFTWGIPLEFENRHVNQLITLIKVFSAKNAPSRRMSNRDIASRNASLNAARRKRYGSRG